MSRFSRIVRVERTGSTNEDVAKILGEESTRGLTLVADYQEHGSGRKGRSWFAPPKSSLLCTIALPDPMPSADLWVVPFWTALMLGAALRELGISPQFQWPNDLLLNGRKMAGILCVSRVIGDYAWVGCGLGVNVVRPHAHELAHITPPPAFLSDLADVDRDRLLDAVLRNADTMYELLHAPLQIAHKWEEAAGFPGVRYCIALDDRSEPFEATALCLLTGGALLVEQNGKQREIALADARVLREEN